MIIILLPWAFIIGGWQIRNYYVAGITNLTSVENHNLLYYRCAGILSLTNNISFEKAQEDITNNLQIKYNIRKLSISQINKIKYNEALLYFFNNKLAFLLMTLKSMIILMISPGINTLKDHISIELLHRTLAVLSTCYLLIIYSCILFYFISLFTKKYKPTILDLFCFIFILYILIISAGPEGCSRFRVPIMPLLAISSGIGFSNLISLFPNNGKRIY